MSGSNPASNADIWPGTINMSKEPNMVKLINCYTGTAMWVAEDRVEEYKAAGHKLAVSFESAEPAKKPAAKKKTTPKKK